MGSAGVNCMSVVIGPQTLWISANRQWPASLVRTCMWNWARRWTNSYLNLLPPLINIQHFCPVSIESLTLKLLWDIPQLYEWKLSPALPIPSFIHHNYSANSLLAAKEDMLGNSLSTSILLLLLLFSPSQVQLRKLQDSKYSQLFLRKQSYEQLFVPVFFTTIYLLSFIFSGLSFVKNN